MASISLVNAQTKTASGTVISSEDGLAVIGASVMVKGTSQGTVTLTCFYVNFIKQNKLITS